MKRLLFILVGIVLLSSCDPEESIGPDLNDLFGPFDILTEIVPNQNTVNFSDGQEIFWSGELSKNTDWVIRLEGQSSGAVRTITGSDRLISITNSEWLGGANTFPGFALETADYLITFPNEEDADSLSGEIVITGLKIDDGDLVSGFEDGFGSSWESFNQTTVTGTIVCGDDQAASGDCYYSISGTVGWDWALGSVRMVSEEGNFGLPNSPTNLYFNMGLQVEEHIGQSFVEIWIDEDEDGDGVWEVGQEDRIVRQYWSETSDWDLVSFNYADLKFDELGDPIDFGGNGLMEPGKVIAVNVFFLSNRELGYNRALIDQIIFTEDEPYRP